MKAESCLKLLFLFVVFILIVWTLQLGDKFGFDQGSISQINGWIMTIRAYVGL